MEKAQVTDALFEEAYSNKDNKKIIRYVCSQYADVIPPDELKSCGMIGLWKCLMAYEEPMPMKFTSSLYNYTKWECLKEMDRIKKGRTFNPIGNFPAPSGEYEMIDFLDSFSTEEQSMIEDRYVNKFTLEEMADIYSISHETIRKKIKKTIEKTIEKCHD